MVYTDVRPVPLHHYIYPAGADGLHLVVDETVGEDFDWVVDRCGTLGQIS